MSSSRHSTRQRRNRLLPPAVAVLFVLVVVLESDRALRPPVDANGGSAGRIAADESPQGGDVDASNSAAALRPRAALGQMIVGRFSGTQPPPPFLARVRRGEIGGAILFADNLEGGEDAVRSLVERLHDAAEQGGNPPLLVMVDQEGGAVKRLPGPPAVAPSQMTDDGEAYDQGLATGRYLRGLGIDVDLAPVADVGLPGSFLGNRAFGSSAAVVAGRACAFATGLRDGGVAATLKHFPGLGEATVNTDETQVTIEAEAATVRAGYAPYRECADEPETLVMVSSAHYPALTAEPVPAVMSAEIYEREMEMAGIEAVTISDDLEAPAIAGQTTPALRSIQAGLDLLLYARSEATSAYAFSQLLADLRSGAIDRKTVIESANRILALKAQLAG